MNPEHYEIARIRIELAVLYMRRGNALATKRVRVFTPLWALTDVVGPS